MGLYENVKKAANAKGYSINRLEKEWGFARSYIGKFKTITPSVDKIQKIADFLGVSTDYLMTGKEDVPQAPQLNARDKRDIAKDLESIMEKLNNQEDGPASFDGQDIPEDDRELFAAQLEAMLVRLKKINKDLYNPNKNKK